MIQITCWPLKAWVTYEIKNLKTLIKMTLRQEAANKVDQYYLFMHKDVLTQLLR